MQKMSMGHLSVNVTCHNCGVRSILSPVFNVDLSSQLIIATFFVARTLNCFNFFIDLVYCFGVFCVIIILARNTTQVAIGMHKVIVQQFYCCCKAS